MNLKKDEEVTKSHVY